VPDWILLRNSEKKLRNFILEECFLNGIISLPNKTFYTTNQKTFILILTKKDKKEDKQTKPVFTYLVSDIWETLDIYRFDTWKSDLEKAKNLFRMFEWNENYFTTDDKKCKVQSILKFENEKAVIKLNEFEKLVKDAEINYLDIIRDFSIEKNNSTYKEFQIWWKNWIFDIKKWKSIYTKNYINDNKWTYPVYSSQTTNDWIIWKINTYDYEQECLTWTTDWTYVWTVFYRNWKFSMTSHCWALFLKEKYIWKIYLPYMKIILNQELQNYKEWEWSNKRLWSTIIKDVSIKIPINSNWEFDFEAQKVIFNNYEKSEKLKNNIENIFLDLFNNNIII